MLKRIDLRTALGALALAALAGCQPAARERAMVQDTSHDTMAMELASSRTTDGHEGMACAACHSGAQADSGLASVPRATCTSSKCHEDGGPPTVRAGSISFPHRNHGQKGDVNASCAGCHDHHEGADALHVDVDACALCHVAEVSGEKSSECRTCHQQPNHVALTSQALPIPHSSIPWVETGCVRCHYDVARPPVKVSTQRCAACHTDLQRVIAAGIGDNLHPRHEGISCIRCHSGGAHRVQAMSSAVELVCSDCHTTEHGLRMPSEWNDSETCDNCHQTVHQAQQRLLLGTPLDDGGMSAPSTKFLAGITCRSCHIRPPGTDTTAAPVRGQAEACAGCHRGEYRQVLDWWVEGTRTRGRSMLAYTERAVAELTSAPDTAQRLAASALTAVQLVAEAGGQHNLELADRIFRESSARTVQAYRLAGRVPPAPPALGTSAHEGLCTYCHYGSQGAGNLRQMPADFHAQVMKPKESK